MARRDRPVRLVVVGCGDIAVHAHLPTIDRSPDVRLVGLVDTDDEARERLADTYGVPGGRTLDDAMAWRPEAAVVATPPEVTPRLTLDLVRLGLPVLCEKPMAVDVGAARAVHDAVAGSGGMVQVGFVNRFSPVIAAVRRWVRDGRLGHPLVFTLSAYDERFDPSDVAHYRRIRHFLEHGPAFVHEAAHHTDYVFHIGGGRVREVTALGTVTHSDLPADNYTAALVSYDNGNLARLEVGWMFPALPPSDFRILGPAGSVRVSRAEGWATLDSADGQERVTLDRPWVEESFDNQLAAFVTGVRTGRLDGPGTADGLASLTLCQDVAAAAARARQAAPERVGERP